MSEIFFTSDTHFGHANIIKYSSRPYKDVEEMNEDLIKKWNSKVGNCDVVYHLGDFSFGSPSDAIRILDRLDGRICYIRGNHDKSLESLHHFFESFEDVQMIKVGKQNIWLSHYCHLSWPKQGHGSWHLFGHDHGTNSVVGTLPIKCFDVGVDCHNGYPLSFDEVKEKMDKLEFIPVSHHGQTTS